MEWLNHCATVWPELRWRLKTGKRKENVKQSVCIRNWLEPSHSCLHLVSSFLSSVQALPHVLANGRLLFYNVTCKTESAQILNDQGTCRDLHQPRASCTFLLPAERCSCALTASNSAGSSPRAQIWLLGASETGKASIVLLMDEEILRNMVEKPEISPWKCVFKYHVFVDSELDIWPISFKSESLGETLLSYMHARFGENQIMLCWDMLYTDTHTGKTEYLPSFWQGNKRE